MSKYPIDATLQKEGEMIYFSQLDLVSILERALRRSMLPVYYTQGFNPHVKISFKNGLRLGLSGHIKIVFYFTEPVDLSRLLHSLNPQLPCGLSIVSSDI